MSEALNNVPVEEFDRNLALVEPVEQVAAINPNGKKKRLDDSNLVALQRIAQVLGGKLSYQGGLVVRVETADGEQFYGHYEEIAKHQSDEV